MNPIKIGANIRGAIVFDLSKDAIVDMINETKLVGGEAAVIITRYPIICNAPDGQSKNVEAINGTPVAIVATCPPDQIFVTDTQTFCDVKQQEKEMGLLNEN